MKALKKNKKKVKPLNISSPENLFLKIDRFESKNGFAPQFILTTPENVKILMEWFGATPDCIRFSLRGVPIVTPRDIILI